MSTDIQGDCEPAFEFVRELLAHELASGRAIGQAVAIIVEGETVVHLWGGHADAERRRPWTADTICCLFSASKPLAAACALKLIERGCLELDAPVARYWPEFAQEGKQATTVRHALAHLAGVPTAESAPLRSVYDREKLAQALEAQRPLWPAGAQLCFHSFTYGILMGELVRHVTGRSLPAFFRSELAEPLDLDIAFALDAGEQARCADVVMVEDNPLFRAMTDPHTPLGRSWRPMPWAELNTPRFRSCDFPSIGGHGSALGLARFYASMASGGELCGARLLDGAIVQEALTTQRHEHDVFMGAPVRMGLGFMLANDVFRFTGRSSAFAQPGLGGVAGIGDTDGGIGIGVVCNRLSAGIEDPFLEALLERVVTTI
jgi:CubicO group peptidase (beta-lactamase class C family)